MMRESPVGPPNTSSHCISPTKSSRSCLRRLPNEIWRTGARPRPHRLPVVVGGSSRLRAPVLVLPSPTLVPVASSPDSTSPPTPGILAGFDHGRWTLPWLRGLSAPRRTQPRPSTSRASRQTRTRPRAPGALYRRPESTLAAGVDLGRRRRGLLAGLNLGHKSTSSITHA